MVNNKISGLFCYMRQLALSIDRRIDNKDSGLQLYFEERVRPKTVISYYSRVLSDISKKDELESNVLLTSNQINRALDLLKSSEIYLETMPDDDDKILRLRMDLSFLSEEVGNNIPIHEKKVLEKVEHYNQNDILETYSLQVLAPEWFRDLGSIE